MKMDLFELESLESQPTDDVSNRYRFSWIAFDQEEPAVRVLFDCHTSKEPHFHIDDDLDGQPFCWESVTAAIELFRIKVTEHFGELLEICDEGG